METFSPLSGCGHLLLLSQLGLLIPLVWHHWCVMFSICSFNVWIWASFVSLIHNGNAQKCFAHRCRCWMYFRVRKFRCHAGFGKKVPSLTRILLLVQTPANHQPSSNPSTDTVLREFSFWPNYPFNLVARRGNYPSADVTQCEVANKKPRKQGSKKMNANTGRQAAVGVGFILGPTCVLSGNRQWKPEPLSGQFGLTETGCCPNKQKPKWKRARGCVSMADVNFTPSDFGLWKQD